MVLRLLSLQVMSHLCQVSQGTAGVSIEVPECHYFLKIQYDHFRI